MSILSAAQAAFIRLNLGPKPDTLFSTDRGVAQEIIVLANEVASDIMRGNDWRGLIRRHEITGDGQTMSFPMPVDYDRMTLRGDVVSPGAPLTRFTPAGSVDGWQDMLNGSVTVPQTDGYWIILDSKFQIWPVLSQGQKAQFYYISRNIVNSALGEPKAQFDTDSDEFLYGDRLMTLGIIWQWKAMKGMDYAEAMVSYEKALSEIMGREKGSNVIRKGVDWPMYGSFPWPFMFR